ncbi:hypothetical protein N431DRAFT_500692 [Stipitochalara longipes BDJ]|nr:hypothetical protein N431DRAFT_500692 [Stipitochalara longipes BDJ]
MELPPGFASSEARKDEQLDMFSIWNIAFANHEILPWIMRTLGARMAMDDTTISKITEVSSEWALTFHRGWTGLRFPWRFRPSIVWEQKKIIQAQEFPTTLEEMNLDVFAVLAQVLGPACDYEYDPESDYHRMGINVLQGYQRMGFGSGHLKWIPASPNGSNMFKMAGFREVAILDAHMERYGYDTATGKMYTLCKIRIHLKKSTDKTS